MEEQQPDYSKLHLLTPNSQVRTCLSHLVGSSSEEDHDTWPFTEVFARPTPEKKGVSMLSKFQGKRESLSVLWCWGTVTSACARSARQALRTVHTLAEADVLVFPREIPTTQLQLSISRHRNTAEHLSPPVTASADMSTSPSLSTLFFPCTNQVRFTEVSTVPLLFTVFIRVNSQEQQ